MKGSPAYATLADGLKNEKLEEVLTGVSPFGLSSPSDYLNQQPSLIVLYFHILALDNIIPRDLLNTGLSELVLDKHNTLLGLDYLYSFLMYRKKESLLTLDVPMVLERVKRSSFFAPNSREQSFLVENIKDLMTKNENALPEKEIDLSEALKLFTLIVIVKSAAPTTEHKMSEFFNYRCDIFENFSPIFSGLEKEGMIQKKVGTSFVFEGTSKAVTFVNSAPIDVVFRRLRPDGEKSSFYDSYTALLK